MPTDEMLIEQTKNWIEKVVIGCNCCPFAAREVRRGSVFYEIERSTELPVILKTLLEIIDRLDENDEIATVLIVLPNGFADFETYLDLVDLAELALIDGDNEGIYQLASFHPDYCFADSEADDAANFTNRSPYPMLHLLREAGIDDALENFPDPEKIPERNADFARKKGLAAMRALRDSCF